MKIGSRVTWFSDGDYWGTVTEVDGGYLTVQWDDIAAPRTHESWQVQFRHNMAAVS